MNKKQVDFILNELDFAFSIKEKSAQSSNMALDPKYIETHKQVRKAVYNLD